MLLAMLLEKNKAIYTGCVNRMEEKSLPPSDAFPKDIVCANNLVGLVHPQHSRIVVMNQQGLFDCFLGPFVAHFLTSLCKDMLIHCVNCAHETRSLLILPLEKQHVSHLHPTYVPPLSLFFPFRVSDHQGSLNDLSLSFHMPAFCIAGDVQKGA